ncbi:tripeptide aminopeptidase [Vibrio ishigakensis]|uniref:Tripeptide aminopeptidase n=1 Tax=Vibrio ishigakensis TaxID=1481914 RepID=A0A0B8QLG5_9VIBR|nr:tripeptide aminopeptidase [Vibrio ishigakensis]
MHPGTAKDKMINSMNIAAQFQMMMPAGQTPECTQGYEAFITLNP